MAEKFKKAYTFETEDGAKKEKIVKEKQDDVTCTDPVENDDGGWTIVCTFPPL